MLTRRTFSALAAGLPITANFGGTARAEGELTLPIATWGSPQHINIVEFLDPLTVELQKRAKGRIKVQHFPAGQLANDASMSVAIPTGKVKIGWSTLALWSGLVPDVKIGDAPTGLTMQDFGAAIGGADGIKAVLDKQFAAKGAKILAVTDLGPVCIVSNKPIRSPADLKGVRIRVFSEGTTQLFAMLGAAPLIIPFGDVYAALQKGTIDAALIGFPGVKSQRMYEITKHLLVPASFCGTGLQAYVANLEWWNGIAAGDRKIIQDSIDVVEKHCQASVIEDRSRLEIEYKQRNMQMTSLAPGMKEYAEWKSATAPALTAAEKSLSPAVIAPVKRQLAKT